MTLFNGTPQRRALRMILSDVVATAEFLAALTAILLAAWLVWGEN